MNYYTMQITSGVTQLLITCLWGWIVVLLLRQRTKGAWLVLIGTILTVVNTFFFSFGRPLLGSLFGFSMERSYYFIGMLGTMGRLLTAGGLLMHLLQRRSQSERIVELEAIIRDRDGMQ